MKSIPIITIAAAMAASLALGAEKVPPPDQQEAYQQKLFDLMDANDDGILSEKEFVVFVLWDEFRFYDKNGDGKVTKAEYEKVSTDNAYFAKLDPSNKGYVTFEDCLGSREVAKELHDEWKIALDALGLKNVKAIKRTDLPDLTPTS